jgi:hypothetical protein
MRQPTRQSDWETFTTLSSRPRDWIGTIQSRVEGPCVSNRSSEHNAAKIAHLPCPERSRRAALSLHLNFVTSRKQANSTINEVSMPKTGKRRTCGAGALAGEDPPRAVEGSCQGTPLGLPITIQIGSRLQALVAAIIILSARTVPVPDRPESVPRSSKPTRL